MNSYLDRTKDFDHKDRVWVSTVKWYGKYSAVCQKGDTLRG